MVNSNVDEKNTKSLVFVLAIILVMTTITNITISTTNVLATKKSSSSLTQIPSKATDFPNNNQNAIEVHVTNAKKDSIGTYHVRGEITNLSNDTTLQFVKVTAHIYDKDGQSLAVTTCCYADPSSIEPGHTSTFDSFTSEDELSGNPVPGNPSSFRLSFDWR
jgi:hypothetical protein